MAILRIVGEQHRGTQPPDPGDHRAFLRRVHRVNPTVGEARVPASAHTQNARRFGGLGLPDLGRAVGAHLAAR